MKPQLGLQRLSYSYQEVESPASPIRNGSVVEVESAAGDWVGRAFYNRHARVRLRMLTDRPDQPIDDHFFRERLGAALELRECLDLPAVTEAYRLVHGEGDHLPGLVIDRFGQTLVMEFVALGMFRRREWLKAYFREMIPGVEIYTFSKGNVQKQESYDHYADPLPAPRELREHGVIYRVHPGSQHKTGFFVDQRDNRARFAGLLKGGSVLDLCCHAGGFGLAAKVKGAQRVVGIDWDPAAIAQATENARLNGVSGDWRAQTLEEYFAGKGEKFDAVVLDPPRQTKAEHGKHAALRRYFTWNREALKRVKPGGWLITCSCSGWVRDEEFRNMLSEVEQTSGRRMDLVRWSTSGADHPFQLRAPQTHYLKVAWFRVP